MTAMLNIAVNTDVTAQLSSVEQSRAEHIIVGNTDVTAQLSSVEQSRAEQSIS